METADFLLNTEQAVKTNHAWSFQHLNITARIMDLLFFFCLCREKRQTPNDSNHSNKTTTKKWNRILILFISSFVFLWKLNNLSELSFLGIEFFFFTLLCKKSSLKGGFSLGSIRSGSCGGAQCVGGGSSQVGVWHASSNIPQRERVGHRWLSTKMHLDCSSV